MSYAVRVRRKGHSDTLKYTTLTAVTQETRSGLKNLFGSAKPGKLGLSIATRAGELTIKSRHCPAWTTANEGGPSERPILHHVCSDSNKFTDIPGRSTAAESTELYYGAVLTTMASFSTASFSK